MMKLLILLLVAGMYYEEMLRVFGIEAVNIIDLRDLSAHGFSRPKRQERSIVQFEMLIQCVTGRSGLDYIGYGCWCGKGGNGTPLDDLDRCCHAHDLCWDAYSADDNCFWSWSPFLEQYDYTLDCKTSITCDSSNSECEKQLCECDRVAAMCFASKTFNTAYADYDKDRC